MFFFVVVFFFSCFGIPMLSIYELWTFYVHFTYSCTAMLLKKWNQQPEFKPWMRLFAFHIVLIPLAPDIGLAVRMFANGSGDLGSIPGRVIPKTQMVLDASSLNTQHYKVWIKGKVEQSRERSSAPHTPWCSSYWKGRLWVILD